MLAALVVLLRTLGLLCRGHRAIALENLALRQQLSIFRRTVRRPHLRTSDRVFWVLLAKAWQDWRTALIVVQPDTGHHGGHDQSLKSLANPYAERPIGSIQRECLDHVIVLGERHLRRLLTAYLTYYHGRAHIWPWRRTRRRHDAFRRRQKDPSSRSLELADYIIATNDVLPDGHR